MGSQQIELFTTIDGNSFPSNSSFLKNSFYVISIGVIYFLLVKVCILFFIVPSTNFSAFWPINGIYASFLLMSPRFLWKYICLVVFFAILLGNILSEYTLSLSIGFGVANVIEGGLIAYLCDRWSKPKDTFSNFRNFFKFLSLVIFSTLLGAILGALNLSFSYSFSHFLTYFSAWFSADVIGNVLMLSVFFTWNDKQFFSKSLKANRVIWAVILFISTIILSILIHSQEGENELVPLNYMVFPLLIWAAVQFKVKGASMIVLVIATVAHLYTINGQGIFVIYDMHIQAQMFWLQCYLAIVFLTAITLALAISERDSVFENLIINKMLVDEVPKAIVVCRLDNHLDKSSFRIVAANKSAANLAKINVDRLLGQYLTESFFGRFNADVFSDFQAWVIASQGAGELPELIIKTEEGPGKKIYKCDSMYVGESCIGIFYEDITGSKKVEELHRQAIKLESLSTLAGSLAHDFNNVLGIISGYTELGIASSLEDSKEESYFRKIGNAGERASLLVKKIIAFSRVGKTELKPLNLSQEVERALEMVNPAINKNIEIQQDIYQHDHLVLADEIDIYQIILNLCINSSDAFEKEAGVIQVTLYQQLVDANQQQTANLKDKKYLKLDITDTGRGIPEKIRENIFDPFFTTKDLAEGTGHGLSIVYGTMKQYGGNITFESEVGKGTTFSLFFPIETEKVIDISDDRFIEALLPSKKTGHILIVDDEPLLLNLYSNFLKGEGFAVTSCSDGKEALEVYIQHPNKFDLVFTDNEMPNISGKQLCQTILSINKHQFIIFATGYSSDVLEKDIMSLGCKEFLLKPVKLNRLVQALTDAAKSSKV